jgi:hypothetical protein
MPVKESAVDATTLSDVTPSSTRALIFEGRRLEVVGRGLRIGRIFDEVWIDGSGLNNPDAAAELLRESGTYADLFTFSQSLPNVSPQFQGFCLEWDNIAVARSADFRAWWDSLPQESRKNVRRSQKRGVEVRPVAFDDVLVHGIKQIYDETPYRQGRRFWHYGKDVATVRRENSSYLERSEFIGAYLQGELIGFIKMVRVGSSARIMQILSMNRHFDKNVTNALVTAAMERCSQLGIEYFIYGQYIYGKKNNSSVTEFKRRNGFRQVLLPRYYIPLTLRGRAALATGIHRGVGNLLPEFVLKIFLDSRSFVYERLARHALRTAPLAPVDA